MFQMFQRFLRSFENSGTGRLLQSILRRPGVPLMVYENQDDKQPLSLAELNHQENDQCSSLDLGILYVEILPSPYINLVFKF